ncbi:NADPH:quinone reductase [Alicyclobacillus contaminans]|uniref:Zinc-type alcohol dehydrogenase-like protein n=2 Tax=Tetragenococcus osmophilus TaxID=526944 RepID=A0AA38CY19_9ENTE|nr:zinc-binding alcohol dehydrogenase family protein [Tetragenococcus osmophilus]GMA55066.1 NADPH:quinone reductase [Alicyclobacillus contaminans]GMA71157.1 NADPH:quinone reductase [Tetragenococcus osmophilus]
MENTMKAVGLYRYLPIDNPESLLDLTISKPQAKGRDLLVRVKAISVNPVDTKIRSPKEKVEEEPKILGWDVAGIVEEVGEDCSLFHPGDEVFYAGDSTRQGANSQFHVVDERIVGKKPSTLDFAAAASLPLTSLTAYEALFEHLAISHNKSSNVGKKLLIINGAGGVGSIATQLAKNVDLTVIATASRQETRDWVKQQGADVIINHHQDLLSQLQKENISDVDYVLCLHSTEMHWANMADVIAPLGKICSIVETEESVDLGLLKNKSATFSWEFMFTKSLYQTPSMITQHEYLDAIAEMVEDKQIHATVNHHYGAINAENLKKAHKQLESDSTIGKIVLEGFD